MTTARVFDERICALGEGALWHPERNQLFWFDILNRQLLSRDGDTPLSWSFPEQVSAAGWIDRDTLMVGGASALWRFDIPTGAQEKIVPLEADMHDNRSNDGRADPMGGFWISTMSCNADARAGAIYRYFRGEVRQIFRDMTIPNSICFAPDKVTAYFSDTDQRLIWRQTLDMAGWPSGRAEVFLDFSNVGLNPDGAVCDAEGNLWIAQWGAWRVACHGPDGRFLRALPIGGAHTTCPVFGGPDFSRMYVTTATQGLPGAGNAAHCEAGKTWIADTPVAGFPERRVVL